jgi:DNA-binding transcriptional MocR family regulator
MVEALQREFGTEMSWPVPRGGFFLWATLPEQIDADALIARAVQEGVIYVAGEAFFVEPSARNIVRLSFSAPTPDRIRTGVSRLAAAVRAELASLNSPAAAPRPATR